LRHFFLLLLTVIVASTIQAQHHHDDGLHFSHPLITESPSPDTKVRFDYFYRRFRADRTTEHSPRVEFEYAFKPSFSVEVTLPYTFRKVEGEPTVSHTDSMDVAVKLTSGVFKDHHVLLVYGVEFGLPMGSNSKAIGSSHIIEVEPYVGAGLKREKVEVVGFTSISAPTNKRLGDEEATALSYQLSFLFKPTPSVQPMIELDGETGLSGSERGDTVVNLSPGIKFRPLHSEHWQVGAGIGFPITNRKDFDRRVVVSAFYHF
jgi:outer membrane protein W